MKKVMIGNNNFKKCFNLHTTFYIKTSNTLLYFINTLLIRQMPEMETFTGLYKKEGTDNRYLQ